VVAVHFQLVHFLSTQVTIACGTMRNQMTKIMTFTLKEPSGYVAEPPRCLLTQRTLSFRRWVHVPLGEKEGEGQNAYLRTFVLSLQVSKMHQSGRDTRIHQLSLIGPKPASGAAGGNGHSNAGLEMASTRMHTMR
jgi:hypothetical protein